MQATQRRNMERGKATVMSLQLQSRNICQARHADWSETALYSHSLPDINYARVTNIAMDQVLWNLGSVEISCSTLIPKSFLRQMHRCCFAHMRD